jgi:hypothetical protein
MTDCERRFGLAGGKLGAPLAPPGPGPSSGKMRCRALFLIDRPMRPKQMAPSEPASYRRWKAHAAALLLRLGIPAGPWSRDHDLRQMYINGATPEQAVEQVEAHYWNARSLERMRPKR